VRARLLLILFFSSISLQELVSNIDKKMFVVGFRYQSRIDQHRLSCLNRFCSSALSSPPLVEHPAVWAKLVHEIVCLMAPAQGIHSPSFASRTLDLLAETLRSSAEGWRTGRFSIAFCGYAGRHRGR
jgi:hypothetical protein